MLINNSEYFEILNNIKERIKTAQYKAVLGANSEQILLYWNIGKILSKNIKYGNTFVSNLARDIKLDFPNSKGYSERNLRYMRKFAETITNLEILQTLSAKLSWSHNTLLLDKSKTQEEMIWYSKQTIENGWSLSALEHHIEVSEKDYYIDLLFYNTKLRCFVVIELKNTEFKPEYAGKLNFYLSAIDDILKHETDNPSIGIML